MPTFDNVTNVQKFIDDSDVRTIIEEIANYVFLADDIGRHTYFAASNLDYSTSITARLRHILQWFQDARFFPTLYLLVNPKVKQRVIDEVVALAEAHDSKIIKPGLDAVVCVTPFNELDTTDVGTVVAAKAVGATYHGVPLISHNDVPEDVLVHIGFELTATEWNVNVPYGEEWTGGITKLGNVLAVSDLVVPA